MPQLGETVTEGTITRWIKAVGEHVDADEPLFEVSTDKVDSEVPSPASGYLAEIVVPEGETVEVGARLAVLSDAAPSGAPGRPGRSAAEPAGAAPPPGAAPAEPPPPPAPAATPRRPRRLLRLRLRLRPLRLSSRRTRRAPPARRSSGGRRRAPRGHLAPGPPANRGTGSRSRRDPRHGRGRRITGAT